MEAFKDRYNKKSISEMAAAIKTQYPAFDEKAFLRQATQKLNNLEMKARVVQISEALHVFLPGPFRKNCKIIVSTLKKSDDHQEGLSGFILWPYTYYVESQGLKHVDVSMKTLYELTKRFTSEWGVRPLLEHHPDKVYALFSIWTKDKCEHIRRWVSEGSRPNLPWGAKISHMEERFEQNIQLLEALKEDPSLYVRTSVANHLNDISWYEPKLVIATLKNWSTIKTPAMISLQRRALRSLLKQGHPPALKLLGYNPNAKTKVTPLKISKNRIKEGDRFNLEFTITSLSKKTENLMIDYVLGYPKANGKISKKTFKLKTTTLKASDHVRIKKEIHFKKVTTRKHYLGRHTLEVQVNGEVHGQAEFELR